MLLEKRIKHLKLNYEKNKERLEKKERKKERKEVIHSKKEREKTNYGAEIRKKNNQCDLAKFCHFGKILKLFGQLLKALFYNLANL